MNARRICFRIFTALTALMMVGSCGSLYAESPTYYFDFTHSSRDAKGNTHGFFGMDTLYAPLRSDDTIAMKGRPYFYNFPVITSAPCFSQGEGYNPYFQVDPVFNAPEYTLPAHYSHLHGEASPFISSHNGRFRTVFNFKAADDQLEIYQYPEGHVPYDSLIRTIRLEGSHIVYVDGDADIKGVVAGRWTVYVRGDIGLLDNLIYKEANPQTGNFIEDSTESMLAVVSDQNIIIRNTLANGRNNGYNIDPQNYDRHSIFLNGSYIALRGSFTFEDWNDSGDVYQGPAPDNRGEVFLKGGRIQYLYGPLSTTNHRVDFRGFGTGFFRRSFQYDFRLIDDGPPGFAPLEYPELGCNYGRETYFDTLNLREDQGFPAYAVLKLRVGVLILQEGTGLLLRGADALTITNHLSIRGSAERPVTFWSATGNDSVKFEGESVTAEVDHLITHEGATFSFFGDSVSLRNSDFGGGVAVTGAANIDSCRFDAFFDIISNRHVEVRHSLIFNGLDLRGESRHVSVSNCTIISGSRPGILIEWGVIPTIVNNIIAFNRVGVQNNTPNDLTVSYCDLFGNDSGDVVNADLGEGCITSNALFMSYRGEDFRLRMGSPCIDAGDPDSPRDPDGSRADIGAFAIDHRLDVAESAVFVPSQMELAAYPNPFNSTTFVSFQVAVPGLVRVNLFDISGRMVRGWSVGDVQPGSGRFIVDGSGLTTGRYYLTLAQNGKQVTTPLTLVK